MAKKKAVKKKAATKAADETSAAPRQKAVRTKMAHQETTDQKDAASDVDSAPDAGSGLQPADDPSRASGSRTAPQRSTTGRDASVLLPENDVFIDEVEAETQKIGNWLFEHTQRRKPSIFERRWWDDHILNWAMADESVKVQMFRFVDALPMLKSHESVTRHLQEYFEEVDEHLPSAVRLVVDHAGPNTVLGRALSYNARSNAKRMAERFIAGHSTNEVLKSVTQLRKQGFAFTLDLLGESVVSEPEANRYRNAYSELIDGLSDSVNAWSEDPQLDHDHNGPIPRMNVSLKMSALCSQFRPVDPRGTSESIKKRLRPILRKAIENSAYVHIDMEQYEYKNLTLQIFKDVLMEDEFRQWPDVGIVIQAYLPDAEQDLLMLRDWVAERGAPITVRLVKGAYWDYETVIAEQRNWPVPVFLEKHQSDANFERLSRFLLENYETLRPAFASHNLRSLSHAIAWGRKLNVPKQAYEIQMLYGMAEDHARLFHQLGHRVRIYTPFGELLPGMAYLVRRLLENTSNDSFLRHSLAEDIAREKLMAKPSATAESTENSSAAAAPEKVSALTRFKNEPLSDFSKDAVRDSFLEAMEFVTSELGREYPLMIGGRPSETRGRIVSRNPSKKSEIVGSVGSATSEDVVNAIETARKAFHEWARTDPKIRCEYLTLVAKTMRERRFELAAWQVYECGKPWIEADADVAEAIDFCEYYALQAEDLLTPREVDLSGEENTYFFKPRGVTAVIAPWNFPLAILTGMTAAAIVTGNTVIMKPAEQSSVIAAKLMEIFQDCHLPEGVVSYLPGIGEEVGPELVGSPDVDVVAFTGSREVGLEINRLAAATDPRQSGVKKVIAEMGGKNAIIVDDDADLDEAVLGVVQSAFSYSGQKCSACSRVIVLRDIYVAFLKRLVAAVRSLKIGPAIDPGTIIGPVIDEASVARLKDFIETGKAEARAVLEYNAADKLATAGYFIGPHIFADVDPASRLAQEEAFGPVIAVIPVADLSQAIEVANGTEYALTAGIFSRSPANLKRCVTELAAGNLYLNRAITGALVSRQPFGGFRMSGIGSKAGGPDYLAQFVIPVNITENTLRRGFAPEAKDGQTPS